MVSKGDYFWAGMSVSTILTTAAVATMGVISDSYVTPARNPTISVYASRTHILMSTPTLLNDGKFNDCKGNADLEINLKYNGQTVTSTYASIPCERLRSLSKNTD